MHGDVLGNLRLTPFEGVSKAGIESFVFDAARIRCGEPAPSPGSHAGLRASNVPLCRETTRSHTGIEPADRSESRVSTGFEDRARHQLGK